MIISIRYASHLPVLTKLVEATTGPILELGMGLYSTSYLHWACFPKKRELASYESDERWIRYFRDSRCDFHKIEQITDWSSLKINNYWEIALIDHAPDPRRSIEAGRLSQNARFVVLHDTEPKHDSLYGYSTIYPLFKHRFDYTIAYPHTTVLSNFVTEESMSRLIVPETN